MTASVRAGKGEKKESTIRGSVHPFYRFLVFGFLGPVAGASRGTDRGSVKQREATRGGEVQTRTSITTTISLIFPRMERT